MLLLYVYFNSRIYIITQQRRNLRNIRKERKDLSTRNSSSFAFLCCGVAQRSILGPLLFTIHMLLLRKIIHGFYVNLQGYADDKQIYVIVRTVSREEEMSNYRCPFLDMPLSRSTSSINYALSTHGTLTVFDQRLAAWVLFLSPICCFGAQVKCKVVEYCFAQRRQGANITSFPFVCVF